MTVDFNDPRSVLGGLQDALLEGHKDVMTTLRTGRRTRRKWLQGYGEGLASALRIVEAMQRGLAPAPESVGERGSEEP